MPASSKPRSRSGRGVRTLDLRLVDPSENNVRLFMERESLAELESRYSRWLKDRSTVLPDLLVVRPKGARYELLAGHRRYVAARNAGVRRLPMRVEHLTDEEAYRFIREANNFEGITTVEKAYAVAEMLRLGFRHADVRETFGNIGVDRYARVGKLVNPDLISDSPKLCDPSITVWGYAAQHGADHFTHCLRKWDVGAWDESECWRQFRRTGKAAPPEPYQAGLTLNVDETGTVLRLRGTLDLGSMEVVEDAVGMLNTFAMDLLEIADALQAQGTFEPYLKIRHLN